MARYSPAVISPMLTPMRIGGPSASPLSAIVPPIAWATASTATIRLYGPVWPKPLSAAYTSRGFTSRSAGKPMPRRSIVPGRKFSATTSASRASRFTRSVPADVFRSMAMPFFPRFGLKKNVEIPSWYGPKPRSFSCVSGYSTFTTSAPRSANCIVANGPASAQVKSRMRMPSRGPFTGI